MPFIFFTLMCISLCFLIYFTYNSHRKMRIKAKLITSTLFILIGLAGYFSSPSVFSSLIIVALIFSFFGDFFLALKHKTIYFILGLTSFAIAHIIFSLAFISICGFKAVLLALSFIIGIIGIYLLNSIKDFDFKNLLIPSSIYSVLLIFMTLNGLMLLKTINLFSVLTFIGAVLFLISDIILSFIYFYKNPPKSLSFFNMFSYYIGQGLIALAVLYS